MLAGDRESTQSSGVGDDLCAGVRLWASKHEEVVLFIEQSEVAVTGLWSGFVVCDVLNPLSQAPCVSAVAEMVGYPVGIFPLYFFDARQAAASCTSSRCVRDDFLTPTYLRY